MIVLVSSPMTWRPQHDTGSQVVSGDGPDRARMAALSPLGDILPPVLSSAERPGWNRMLVELHQAGEWEGEARLPFHLVSLVLRPSPRACSRLDGGRMMSAPTAPGDIIVVPAGNMHWASWKHGTDFLMAYLAPEVLARALSDDGLDAPQLEIGYRFRDQDPELASLLLAMHAQLAGTGAEDRLYIDTLGVQLAVLVARRYGTASLRLRPSRHGLSRAKMRIVLDYMNAHLDRNIELAELAGLVDLSQFHFLRLFRLASGATPHHYLVRRRVEVATSILLHEDVTLAEVAYRLGFSDQSHFSRHFRRITGAPPGRLRRDRRAH
jgi:AraC family transcriptional regulator